MKNHELSLKRLLSAKKFPAEDAAIAEAKLAKLQLKMLRIQQGVWHSKSRAIILFEGFDAAGKGGAIQRLTAALDPRSVRVHPFGPPSEKEQGRHYLYRFWRALPLPGDICVFDRSWYGRVLVERVSKLTEKRRWQQAFHEINELEAELQDDGIDLIKIFLAISKDEQYRRFEQRLKDPYKQWKISEDDIRAREHWDDYVDAVDEMFARTGKKSSPWILIAANDKDFARVEVLKTVTGKMSRHADWMEKKVEEYSAKNLRKLLKQVDERKA